eukprot:12260844-Ditylum_brightwellii.AAC.1
MHKPHANKITCVNKEHDKASRDGKGKHHSKSESHYEKHHRTGKHHAGKHKKKFCGYHGLCHHDTKEYNYYQVCMKHIQPTHCITEEQRLWQVHFVKDVESRTKKCGLNIKEAKDLNKFGKDNIDETIKQCNCDMHTMSNFKYLSISLSDESVKSIVSDTSVEDSGNEDCNPASKK